MPLQETTLVKNVAKGVIALQRIMSTFSFCHYVFHFYSIIFLSFIYIVSSPTFDKIFQNYLLCKGLSIHGQFMIVGSSLCQKLLLGLYIAPLWTIVKTPVRMFWCECSSLLSLYAYETRLVTTMPLRLGDNLYEWQPQSDRCLNRKSRLNWLDRLELMQLLSSSRWDGIGIHVHVYFYVNIYKWLVSHYIISPVHCVITLSEI